MKQYINPILTSCSLLALLTTIYFQNERINQFKVEVDSLQHEVFVTQNMLTKYEITLNQLEKDNPEVALWFVNFMNHETE